MINISKKITGYNVVEKNAEVVPVAEAVKTVYADINPLELRVNSRPSGELDAISSKIEYSTMEGRKKLYLLVSFMPFDGIVNGDPVTVERPIEFFLPAGQANEDQQWVSATMRSLSLAARAGFVAKALQDLRAVTWTKGLVRCGTKDYGNGNIKPVMHDSEVAAIAWSIQEVLKKRGFLDADGNEVPAEVVAKRYAKRLANDRDSNVFDIESAKPAIKYTDPASEVKGSQCPECKAMAVTMQAGCNLCAQCGYSKC